MDRHRRRDGRSGDRDLGCRRVGDADAERAVADERRARHLLGDNDAGGAAPGGYDVARGTGPCASSPVFATPVVSASPFTDSPRPPDGTYCYRVTGHGYAGGDTTADVSVTVDATPPTVTISAPMATVVGGVVAVSVSLVLRGSSSVATSPNSAISRDRVGHDGHPRRRLHDHGEPDGRRRTTPARAQRTVTVDNHAPGAFNGLGAVDGGRRSAAVLDRRWRSEPRRLPDPAQRPRRARSVRQRDQRLDRPLQPSRPRHVYLHGDQAIDVLGHVTSAPPLTIVVTAPSASAPQSVSAVSPDEHDAAPRLAAADHVRRDGLADLSRQRARDARWPTRRL